MSLQVPLTVRIAGADRDQHVTQRLRDLSFSHVIPGGMAEASLSLQSPISLAEFGQFDRVYIYDGRNGSTVWQGLLEDPGRSAGPNGQVWSLQASGPAARTRDRKVPLIYIDRGYERFRVFSSTLAMSASVGTDPASSEPAIVLSAPRGLVASAGFDAAMRYEGFAEAGQKLARFDYVWDSGRTTTNWKVIAQASPSGTLARTQTLSVAGGGSSPKVIVTDFTAGDDVLDLLLDCATGETVPDDDTWVAIHSLRILGTRYSAAGSELVTAADYTTSTVLASQIVADLLGRLLPTFDGAGASISTTSYDIEKLAYPDGVTAADVLADLMKLHPTYWWAAWEDTASAKSRFEWSAWPTTVAYEASAVDGFSSPGSSSGLFDAVSVRWRDADGRIRRTRRTQTVQALTDAGISREDLIDLGDELASENNAIQAGDQFLAEHAASPNAGTLTVRRPILDASVGRMLSPWEIRPGKLIRVRDVLPRVDALNATDRDAVTVFRVVATRYEAATNTATLTLDSQSRTAPQAASSLRAAGARRR